MKNWRSSVLAVWAAFIAFAAVTDGKEYSKPSGTIFRKPAPKPSGGNRKPPARKPPARKPPARKPPARKPPAHKPARKPPARKPPARKPPARKPPARKPPSPKPPSPRPPSPTPRFKDCGFDVVDDLASSEDFTILVKLVKAAGLEKALKGPGPFTVLAPNNYAFKKAVGAEGLRKLLLPRNREILTKILKYHVIGGRRIYKHMFRTMKYTTLSGYKLDVVVRKQSKYVRINQTNMITKANFEVCNGVVHVIQDVLIPKGIGMGGNNGRDRDSNKRDGEKKKKKKKQQRQEAKKKRDGDKHF